MKTNDTFSFPRVGTLMKSDFMENRHTLLLHAVGLCAAFLVVIYLETNEHLWILEHHCFSLYARKVLPTCILLILLYFYVTTAGMTTHLRSKSERVRYLMIPAGMKEKFVARALFVCCTAFVIPVVSFLLADLLQFVLLPLCEFEGENKLAGQFLTPELVRRYSTMPAIEWNESGTEYYPWLGSLPMLILYAWQHSLFFLGGCIWNRYAALKTACGQLIVFIVGGFLLWLLFNGFEMTDDMYELLGWMIEKWNLDIDKILLFFSPVFFGFILLNWRLAYRRYSRTQVITPKQFAK